MDRNRAHAQFMHNTAFTVATLFQGKWRIQILCAMRFGPVRLGQLARVLPNASKKVLTQNLRELEASCVVVRKDLSDVVLHIEYELREDTKHDLCALLDHLGKWGETYLKDQTKGDRQPSAGKDPEVGARLLARSRRAGAGSEAG
jgi:DNA-binding HxlR family transcriptional regulator